MMKTIFHKILATTAQCLAAVGEVSIPIKKLAS